MTTAPPNPKSVASGGAPRAPRPSITSNTATISSQPVFKPRLPRAASNPQPQSAPPKSDKAKPISKYRPGLDGMRAIAVVAVVVFHIYPWLLPGGFLGVDVFFVISGYLITSLLVGQWQDTEGIGLTSFWMRRVRRLYPAVVAMVITTIVVGALVAPAAVAESKITLVAALLYVTNWWFIFHHVPYFQSFGRPSPFLHLWSLAIEEQYYLIWPPLLTLYLKYRSRLPAIAGFCLAGAAASAILMGVLYHPGSGLDRVYFGTDTHCEGLLIGSALGIAVPPARIHNRITPLARQIIDWVATVSLIGLVVLMFTMGESGDVAWRGGLMLACMLSALAVVAAVHPASRVGDLLSTRPMRWLGTRSYSIYLWHWPILDYTRPQDVHIPSLLLLVLRVALIGAASELSYRYIETPFRTGAAQRWIKARYQARDRAFRALGGVTAGGVVITLVCLFTASAPGQLAVLKRGKTAAASNPIGPLAGGSTYHPHRVIPGVRHQLTKQPGYVAHPSDEPDLMVRHATSSPTSSSQGGGAAPPATVPGIPGLLRAPAGGPVLAIGDSVLLAGSDDLKAAFGGSITVDAAVGRQVDQGLSRLQQYRDAGRLNGLRALIIGLGTNGPMTSADMQQLMQIARGVPHIILINTRADVSWIPESNTTIDGMAKNPRVTVVNWYSASADSAILYPDGIHPNPEGQVVYANLITRALSKATGEGLPGASPGRRTK